LTLVIDGHAAYGHADAGRTTTASCGHGPDDDRKGRGEPDIKLGVGRCDAAAVGVECSNRISEGCV